MTEKKKGMISVRKLLNFSVAFKFHSVLESCRLLPSFAFLSSAFRVSSGKNSFLDSLCDFVSLSI